MLFILLYHICLKERGDSVAINYKKCLKCGSLNAIKILYGMPTGEAFLLAKEGKIKLGGCCINESNPEYYCKNCEHEWNRGEAINHAYNDIVGIKASFGDCFNDYYKVDIDFQSRKLKLSHGGYDSEDYHEKIIGENNLDDFIEGLKIVNILNWKLKYIEPDVLDGTQWSLEIIKKDRNIKKYGINKFPNQWEDFIGLISKVSGKNFS